MTDSLLNIDALAAAPIEAIPFRHLVVRQFVAPEILKQLQQDVPPVSRGGSFPPEALKLGPVAQKLMEEMEAPALKAAIAAKFGPDLSDAPSMLTMRVHCREKDGQIHTDSVSKRVTALLYLNPEEEFSNKDGCLRLLRSPDNLEDYTAEIPPTNGTLLVFENGPTAWHGHHAFVGKRLSVQLNYMTNDGVARSELRRHKLSAMWKRLTRAA